MPFRLLPQQIAAPGSTAAAVVDKPCHPLIWLGESPACTILSRLLEMTVVVSDVAVAVAVEVQLVACHGEGVAVPVLRRRKVCGWFKAT